MRQRFRARELWLLVPFLLIGAAAFYWARVEQVSQPGASAMFVSDVKIEAAPGYYQAQGMSHRVTVTVSHPWPRPKWWNQHHSQLAGIDALHPEKPSFSATRKDSEDWLEMGEALTIVRGGKVKQLPRQYGGYFVGDYKFDGTNYVSVNYFNLNAVPKEWGAVTLHGLYRIGGTHQVVLEREIRKAGANARVAINQDPGARIDEIDATPFFATTIVSATGKTTAADGCSIRVTVGGLPASRVADETQVQLYDVEVQDETGKKWQPGWKSGLSQSWSPQYRDPQMPLSAQRETGSTTLSFPPALKTRGRLTVRGKVSVDHHWPLSFEVLLPPRVIKPVPASGDSQFSIPLWRDGKPIKAPTK